MKTLRAIPDKPLSAYSDLERALLRGPSVEAHLDRIRRTLALNTLLMRALSQTADLYLEKTLEHDAADAIALMCEDAWSSAHALSEALSDETQVQCVVDDGGAAEDRP